MKLKSNIAVSETGFLFDPNTGDSYNINATGQYILKLLKENKAESDIIGEVTQSFDVEPQIVQRYLDDFIRMLVQFNLLDRDDD